MTNKIAATKTEGENKHLSCWKTALTINLNSEENKNKSGKKSIGTEMLYEAWLISLVGEERKKKDSDFC